MSDRDDRPQKVEPLPAKEFYARFDRKRDDFIRRVKRRAEREAERLARAEAKASTERSSARAEEVSTSFLIALKDRAMNTVIEEILNVFANLITPELREFGAQKLREFADRADQTESRLDDAAAAVLLNLFGVERNPS